jgi:hypothetical protein
MDQAVHWAQRFPFEAFSQLYPCDYATQTEIELRQVFEPEPSDASN